MLFGSTFKTCWRRTIYFPTNRFKPAQHDSLVWGCSKTRPVKAAIVVGELTNVARGWTNKRALFMPQRRAFFWKSALAVNHFSSHPVMQGPTKNGTRLGRHFVLPFDEISQKRHHGVNPLANVGQQYLRRTLFAVCQILILAPLKQSNPTG